METLVHQAEKSVCQGQRHRENDEGSEELDAEEAWLACREEALFLVEEAEGDHTPQATEQMGLRRLQRVIKLESVEQEAAQEVTNTADKANQHRIVNLNVP